MQVQQKQYTGLVADLLPNIRLMRFVGHFLNKFSDGSAFLNKMYSWGNLLLMLLQFVLILVNLGMNTGEVNELTANTVTALHFTHTITKFCYVAMNNKNVYRTFNIWNQAISHPLFAESDARYHAIALAKMRKNLYMITGLTLATVVGWSGITFFGESVKGAFDKETNETYYIEVPRLPIKSYYPFNAFHGIGWLGAFIFQV